MARRLLSEIGDIDPSCRLPYRRSTVGVFADIEAFVQEHRGCGQLEGGAGEPGPYGYGVRLSCLCGASLTRWVTPAAAERALPVTVPLPIARARHLSDRAVVVVLSPAGLVDTAAAAASRTA